METPVVAVWRQVAVGLGSNLGDRHGNMNTGATALQGLAGCRTFCWSSFYETTPVDCIDDLPFLNAAVRFETRLDPYSLLTALLDIENSLGRQRPYMNAPRPLDLDLLFYDELLLDETRLQLPHPRLHQRLFVLVPLTEVAGRMKHPRLGKTVAQLAHGFGEGQNESGVISKSQLGWSFEL